MSDLRVTTAVTALNPDVGDLALDEHGQLSWVGLDPYDAEDIGDMIAQRVRCRILLIKGEWYQDQRQGVPWRGVLWAKGVTRDRIAAVFRQVITGTPGVSSLRSLTVAIDNVNRTGSVTFDAIGDTGRLVGPITLDLPQIVRGA